MNLGKYEVKTVIIILWGGIVITCIGNVIEIKTYYNCF